MATTNDPISDFMTRIRNATLARHDSCKMPASKMLVRLAEILKEEGYVQDVEVLDEPPRGAIVVHIKYLADHSSAIRKLERVSKPSRRRYVDVKDIPRVKNGLGIAILSTSKGVMTGNAARMANVGGEYLCKIW